MSADKVMVVGQIENAIEMLDRMIERIDDGAISFSEAGDWLHNCGDIIVGALESALPYVKEAT